MRLKVSGVGAAGAAYPLFFDPGVLAHDGSFPFNPIRDFAGRVHFKDPQRQRLKDELFAEMFHELRTPLTGIIGLAELLIDEKPGSLNDKQHKYVRDVLASAHHLSSLVNDLLDLMKMEAGKLEFFPMAFLLPQAVDEVCRVLSPLAEEKRILLRQEVAPAVGEVTLDPQRFKQVLYNLVSNAIKFTDDGGSVTVAAAPEPGSRFRLSVQDTGIGIRKEDMGKLFIEFQQIESAWARRCGGTGLGLALTKRMVEMQSGNIQVESEPSRGSIFTVILPTTDPCF